MIKQLIVKIKEIKDRLYEKLVDYIYDKAEKMEARALAIQIEKASRNID